MNLKNQFPFRLGAPSYVVPGDILTNVNYLSKKVDDIELVIFESDEISALPELKTIFELGQVALHNDLTFTVHLPLDIWLGDSDQHERQKSVAKCLRVIEHMQPLTPFGYVFHCIKTPKYPSNNTDSACWRKNIEKSIDELLFSELASNMICIETLEYPFELIEPIIMEKQLSICLDIGHILMNRLPMENYLNKFIKQSRIVHLHGVKEGRDHQEISTVGDKFLSLLFQQLNKSKSSEQVVTVEVFNSLAFNASLSIMEKFIP
jgi:sugar phosphate isomerase/epimerase